MIVVDPKALHEFVRRNARAKASAERALQSDPDGVATLCAVSALFESMGDFATGRAIAERAIVAAPESADAFIQHGVVCRHQGDFATAQKSFWRAVELRPLAARAYHELAHMGALSGRDSILKTLEDVFDDVQGEPERALLAGHAIAKLLEAEDEYEASFDWLMRAKQGIKALVPYDYAEDEHLHSAALEGAATGRRGAESLEPIFIVGLPRTGTTLVDRVLSSHCDVQAAGEISNWPVLINVVASQPRASTLSPQAVRAAASSDPETLGKAYVESTRPITGARPRFTDKSPNNYLLAPLIHRALPNARILCLRRGAMDACVAMFKQALPARQYSFNADIADCARHFLLFDRFVAHCRDTLPGDRFKEVRYESVVENFEAEARALVDFCGLAWDDNCLRFHENNAPVATPSGQQVRSPINAMSIGRWRKYGEKLRPAREVFAAAGYADLD